MKPLVLIILDGWGEGPSGPGNAITQTPTPFFDNLKKNYPFCALGASGDAVGLPHNQDGNSEAGHINLGAGRVVDQDSTIISKSISNGLFFKNGAFISAIEHVKRHESALHLLGILSGDQSPHMDPDHLLALITLAKKSGLKKIYLHLFTDGRDSYYYAGVDLLQSLLDKHKDFICVATLMGRLFLDRKKNWSRTQEAFEAMVHGQGLKFFDPVVAVKSAYERGQTDEFISPSVMVDDKKHPVGLIKQNDAVIFFNLRSDRARQLTKVFVQQDFFKKNPGSFRPSTFLKNLYFVAMTDFGPDLSGVVTAYTSSRIEGSLPWLLKDLRQLYLAETEKYAHMTYFFNGGYSSPVNGEKRELIDSPHVESYARTPAMRVPDLSQRIKKELKRGYYDFIAVNFSSPDMIGHTGDAIAAAKAVSIVDNELKFIAQTIDEVDGVLVITADHGNIEELQNKESHEVNTKHSNYPVPFIVYGKKFKHKNFKKIVDPKLADVAPTILKIFKIKPTKLMTGRSLL